MHAKRKQKLSSGNIVFIECGFPDIRRYASLLHNEMAAAINFAQKSGADTDVANDCSVDGNHLVGLRVDPHSCASMTQPVGCVATRGITRVGRELKLLDHAAITDFATGPDDLESAASRIDEMRPRFHFLLLFREHRDLPRIIGVDGHFQDALPIAKLPPVQSL